MKPIDVSQLAANPLAELRGYHLPEPVSWWPPAPGWWLLVLSGLVLIAAAIHWLAGRHRRRAPARAAAHELAILRAAYEQDADAAAFAAGISRLLRRVALARYPRHQVAGLTGEAWLAFLDTNGGAGRFREGPGRALLEAPYRRDIGLPVEELADLALQWIRHNREAIP